MIVAVIVGGRRGSDRDGRRVVRNAGRGERRPDGGRHGRFRMGVNVIVGVNMAVVVGMIVTVRVGVVMVAVGMVVMVVIAVRVVMAIAVGVVVVVVSVAGNRFHLADGEPDHDGVEERHDE